MRRHIPILVLVAAALPLPAQIEVVSSGNVGIGTTSPSTALEVRKDHATDTVVRISNAQATRSPVILEFRGDYNGTGTLYQLGRVVAKADNAGWVDSRVTLQSVNDSGAFVDTLSAKHGNVGVGTTNPGAKLEVIGGANPFGLVVEGDGVSANARIALRRANAGGLSATGNIDWIGNDNAVGARIGVNDDVGGSMAFKLGGGTSGYTRLFISSAGSVGIGTTNPGNKLSINVTANDTIPSLGSNGGSFGLFKYDNAAGGNYGLLVGVLSTGSVFQQAQRIDGGATAYPMLLQPNGGNVGIGTTTPSQKLEVAGSVRATSFISNTTTYADFVFDPGYRLPALSEVEAHIKREGHLPGIPSEAEAREHGIDLTAMQVKLLQKIEELTLHQIAQEKEIAVLKQQMALK